MNDACQWPALPAFPDGVRLATAADHERLAEVAGLGFASTERFQYRRPHSKEFPADTRNSLRRIWRDWLLNPETVVVVVEAMIHEGLVKQIVGAACWSFPKDSGRSGQFAVSDVARGDEWPTEARVMCRRRSEILDSVVAASEEEWFGGQMYVCQQMVLDPAHQRKGYGSRMLEWGLALSDLDCYPQGVESSHDGERLYRRHGFRDVGHMLVPPDDEASGFSQTVMLRAQSCAS